eukprot:3418657-Prymnesium_polylepis.2
MPPSGAVTKTPPRATYTQPVSSRSNDKATASINPSQVTATNHTSTEGRCGRGRSATSGTSASKPLVEHARSLVVTLDPGWAWALCSTIPSTTTGCKDMPSLCRLPPETHASSIK